MPYVIGQIREVARLYYDTAITVLCAVSLVFVATFMYINVFVVHYDTTITVQVLSADGSEPPPVTTEEIGDEKNENGSQQDRELLTDLCRRHGHRSIITRNLSIIF